MKKSKWVLSCPKVFRYNRKGTWQRTNIRISLATFAKLFDFIFSTYQIFHPMYFEMGSFTNLVFATSAIFYSAVIILIAVCSKVVYPNLP
jgi:hypothetical protein